MIFHSQFINSFFYPANLLLSKLEDKDKNKNSAIIEFLSRDVVFLFSFIFYQKRKKFYSHQLFLKNIIKKW